MNELIKITETNGKKAVSARELHSFLESKQDFSTWIKNRIKKYDLTENEDYASFDKIVEREIGASVQIEYALTLDAAKELSMVEGNAKGKIARKYFIDIDKKYHESVKVLTPAEQLLESVKLTVEHEKQIKELTSKVDRMLEVSQANESAMRALPISTETLPELPVRDKVRMMVNSYASAQGIDFRKVWDALYQKLYFTYHISINSYKAVKKGQSKLDLLDEHGHINKAYIIASDMCRNIGLSTI